MGLTIAPSKASPGERAYADDFQEALSARSKELGRAMSYRDFTLEEVKQRFDLRVVERAGVLAAIPARPVSELLRLQLEEHLPLPPTASEFSRRELIVSPVLIEVRKQLNRRVSVFSGVAFTVDEEQGLNGFSDFLLSRSPEVLEPEAPVVMIVEVKRESKGGGFPQCLAEMVGAQLFNQRAETGVESIYGAVTNGNGWWFLSLTGTDVTIDLTEYYINEVERIVGILVHMLTAEA